MDTIKIFTTIRYDPELLKAPNQGFTGIGWNQNPSPFYMLDLHRDRMLNAARHWRWPAAVQGLEGDQGLTMLQDLLLKATGERNHAHRVKVTLSKDGAFNLEVHPTPPKDLNNLFPTQLPAYPPEGVSQPTVRGLPAKTPEYEIFVNKEMTVASEFTHHKTTHRPMYDEPRHQAGISPGDLKEVLLVNSSNGSVMEGSISTPYFWRNNRWVTPPVTSDFAVAQGDGGNNGTTRRWALGRNVVTEETVPADSLVNEEQCWISNGVQGFVYGRVRLR
ncbi:aminotransferase [Xylariaceae sp. FL0016]|nr:aminotransferase [Xylariaceae sp. FL0016]